jgi:hypothetical protein
MELKRTGYEVQERPTIRPDRDSVACTKSKLLKLMNIYIEIDPVGMKPGPGGSTAIFRGFRKIVKSDY